MAMRLSIDGRNQQGERGRGEVMPGAAAVWVFARLRAMFSLCGRAAREALARLQSVQENGSKRKQMKLVESLPLGNRRQLLLVVCGGQRYLVGAGADSVGSILAIEAEESSRDRNARGPELVRRRGREASREARMKPMPQAGLDLWR